MRRLCATGLTVLLCVHPLLADGALARSVSREASRLAADPARRDKPAGWSVVRQLAPTTPLTVSSADQTATYSFVAADDATLTVLDLDVPGLAPDVKRQLAAIAKANPQALAAAAHGGPKAVDAFRFGRDGVFFHDRKIAERAEVLRQISVDDVMTVTVGPWRRGSAGAAVFAALGGAVAGPLLAYAIAGDHSGASGEGLAWTLMLGLPIVAGYGAWRATSHVTEEIIYRRPVPERP